jgi:hypothetical protein
MKKGKGRVSYIPPEGAPITISALPSLTLNTGSCLTSYFVITLRETRS